jgi:hypothetical protein
LLLIKEPGWKLKLLLRGLLELRPSAEHKYKPKLRLEEQKNLLLRRKLLLMLKYKPKFKRSKKPSDVQESKLK